MTTTINHDKRLTITRKILCNYFKNLKTPADYNQIMSFTKEIGLDVNKTTIYRQLDSLLSEGIILELDFGEGKKRYELNKKHHHHILCKKCKKIQCINIKEDFSEQEKAISRSTNFTITGHIFDFIGLCQKCKKDK